MDWSLGLGGIYWGKRHHPLQWLPECGSVLLLHRGAVRGSEHRSMTLSTGLQGFCNLHFPAQQCGDKEHAGTAAPCLRIWLEAVHIASKLVWVATPGCKEDGKFHRLWGGSIACETQEVLLLKAEVNTEDPWRFCMRVRCKRKDAVQGKGLAGQNREIGTRSLGSVWPPASHLTNELFFSSKRNINCTSFFYFAEISWFSSKGDFTCWTARLYPGIIANIQSLIPEVICFEWAHY